MENYRVTFGGEQIDYHSNFADCRYYHAIIREIRTVLRDVGIDQSWWFFEPYVEITWLCDDRTLGDESLVLVTKLLKDREIEHKTFVPSDGVFGEWYGLTPEERLFGAKRYAAVADVAERYYDHKEVIDDGLGLEKQFGRATHCLANQLGLDYEREGIALLKRGFLCLLFKNLGHEKAVETYETLFKEKYLGKDEDPS